MAYQFVENEVEKAIKAMCVQALSDASITGVSFRTWTVDDETEDDKEDIIFPVITIQCAPNVPNGYREVWRVCQVDVMIATLDDDDPKRATLSAIYNAVRKGFDTFTLSAYKQNLDSLNGLEITDSGAPYIDDRANVYSLSLTVNACQGYS